MRRRTLVATGAMIVGLIAFALWPADRMAQKEEFSVKITDPARDGIEVKRGMTVRGTASLPSGYHLWVLAHRRDFKKFWWPQGEGEIDPQTHEWMVAVTFGGPQDIGWDFEIEAIVVKGQAHAVLQDYVAKAMATGNWNPIEPPASEHPPQVRKVRKVSHD